MKRILYLVMAAVIAACSSDPYIIVQVADAQLGFTAADVSQKEGTEYVNDLTYESECLKKAVEMINDIRPDAVVFTGDQVNRAADEEQWTAFAEIISGIDKSVNVFHLPGNHDVVISEGNVDSTPFTSRYGEDRFVFAERGVRLVGINSNLIKYNDPREVEQKEWLSEVLLKEYEVSIVFAHHPFFMSSIDEEDGYFQIQKEKRLGYFDLFEDKGVDAVYAGHRHNNAEGTYGTMPVRTTTSVAFQIGDARPSIRVITVSDGAIQDELRPI